MENSNLKHPGPEKDSVGQAEQAEQAEQAGQAAKSKENAGHGQGNRDVLHDQPGPDAESGQSSAMTVVTENYLFHREGPEELPDDDPRKGTVSDPNLQDRAWVNRKFTFNLKRR